MSLALLIPKDQFSRLDKYVGYRQDLSDLESIWMLDESDGGDEISLYADEILPTADYADMRSIVRERHRLPGHETVREITTGHRWNKKHILIGVYETPRPRIKYRHAGKDSLLDRARRYGYTQVDSMSASFGAAWKKMRESRVRRYALDADFYFERPDAYSCTSAATLRYKKGEARQMVALLNRREAAGHQLKMDFNTRPAVQAFSKEVELVNNTPFTYDPSYHNVTALASFFYILEKTGAAKVNPFWRRCDSFGLFIEGMRPAVHWLREYRQTTTIPFAKPELSDEKWREQACLLAFARWLTREYLWWRHEQTKTKEQTPCNCTGSDSSTLPSIETLESTSTEEASLLCLAQTA